MFRNNDAVNAGRWGLTERGPGAGVRGKTGNTERSGDLMKGGIRRVSEFDESVICVNGGLPRISDFEGTGNSNKWRNSMSQ